MEINNIIDIGSLGYEDPVDDNIKTYNPGNNTGKPRYRIYENKLVLYLSNTLMNDFLLSGDIKPYCPKRVYHTRLLNDVKEEPSEPMLIGSYFETKCIGSGAGGKETFVFPKKGRGGGKSVVQIRVDDQVTKFFHEMKKREMEILPDKSNVQVRNIKLWNDKNYLDLIVFLTGEADLITPYNYKNDKYDAVIVDLKMTGDLTSTYGPHSWGNLKWKNMNQAVIYHLLFDLPFAYWVFEYGKMGRDLFFFVNFDTEHPDPDLARSAKWRIFRLKEDMRKVIVQIVKEFKTGWQAVPGEYCFGCPIKDCPEHSKTKLI